MRTVKELSDLTGISVRALHYYDEIGLLKPTDKSSAGYRLYDNKALETLQQILFFREFDIPLREIKAVLENSSLQRNQLLQMQRNMLTAKKERLERLIANIDGILRGEDTLDFAVFSKAEIEELFQTMFSHMPEDIRRLAVMEFGSVAQWKTHYEEVLSSENMQKGFAKVAEWYGGKDNFLSAVKNPLSKEEAECCCRQLEAVLRRLSAKRGCAVDSFEVRELVGEYSAVIRQLSQVREETGYMLAQAKYFRNQRIRPAVDATYGEGASDFFALAMESFAKGTHQTAGCL